MNKKILHVFVFFLVMIVAIFGFEILIRKFFNEYKGVYITWVAYGFYAVFISWALIVYKKYFYKNMTSKFTGFLLFLMYGTPMLLITFLILFINYWIVALYTETAP